MMGCVPEHVWGSGGCRAPTRASQGLGWTCWLAPRSAPHLSLVVAGRLSATLRTDGRFPGGEEGEDRLGSPGTPSHSFVCSRPHLTPNLRARSGQHGPTACAPLPILDSHPISVPQNSFPEKDIDSCCASGSCPSGGWEGHSLLEWGLGVVEVLCKHGWWSLLEWSLGVAEVLCKHGSGPCAESCFQCFCGQKKVVGREASAAGRGSYAWQGG